MEQSYYASSSNSEESNPSADAKASLQAAAAAFSQNIQEATGKLAAAAEQFGSVSETLISAVEDARGAAERAQEAQKATEATQERLTSLMRQLQERLSGLASLAQAFDVPGDQPKPETSSEGQQESRPW